MTHYQAYSLPHLSRLPQLNQLSNHQKFEMEVVAHVFPFKTNNYVMEQLIHWEDVPNDPLFLLTFPQKKMLLPHHFEKMSRVLQDGSSKQTVREVANEIRWELNPHPAGQKEANLPILDGVPLNGIQHKYRETVLFFPSQGQTCHAYCSFCFRWPQFVGINELKFATREMDLLIKYIHQHPEITDVLFTGGDPLIMKTKTLAAYIRELLKAELPNLQTIRIGTKALSYWPYRFLTDPDAHELLMLFREVTYSGKHLAFMAHFNHPRELQNETVQLAIQRIHETGAEIRTQSPILAHINDHPATWATLWKEQVRLNCIPYYMFVVRDTGAQHYFGINLEKAWNIFREAYQTVSGIGRTVRGPSLSTHPGKVQVLGVQEIKGEKVFMLQFLQAREPNRVLRPFFAKYDPDAVWLDDLRPAFGEKKFFFED